MGKNRRTSGLTGQVDPLTLAGGGRPGYIGARLAPPPVSRRPGDFPCRLKPKPVVPFRRTDSYDSMLKKPLELRPVLPYFKSVRHLESYRARVLRITECFMLAYLSGPISIR